MTDGINSKGRKANEAQPLGDRDGLVSDRQRDKTAEREKRSAGPDGPDSRAAGADDAKPRDSVAGVNPKAD